MISSLSIRELRSADIPGILDYWFTADRDYLKALGVDASKLPARDDFRKMLESQLSVPYEEKKVYALVWLLNDVAIGHSNLNPLKFGEHAWMHLHLWSAEYRMKGLATELIRLSLPLYFRNFRLREIYCEPYSLNPAPHRVLEKSGFVFEKEYVTIPGSICFEQPVKRWVFHASQLNPLINAAS